MRQRYRRTLHFCLEHAWTFVILFLLFCLGSGPIVFILGRDFFPSVDAGLIRLHVRASVGLRVEETARECDQIDQLIRQVIPPGELANVLDNIGLSYSSLNMSYSNNGTIGTSDAEILIGLKPDHKTAHRTLTSPSFASGSPAGFPGTQFFFQPADIVSQILNFGVPAPIDVELIGRDFERGLSDSRSRWPTRSVFLPGAADVHVQQMYSTPALFLNVDRTRAQSVGLSQNDVAQSVLLTLSSSFQTAPSFWVDPKSGVEYNVAVQVPQYKFDTMQSLQNIPVCFQDLGLELLGNLAQFNLTANPAEMSDYDAQPMVNVYASVQGRDLGGLQDDVNKVVDKFRVEASPWHRYRDPRPSGDHELILYRTRRRFACRHSADLSIDRRELPVVARSFHHHHGLARRPGRNPLDAAGDANHAERPIVSPAPSWPWAWPRPIAF